MSRYPPLLLLAALAVAAPAALHAQPPSRHGVHRRNAAALLASRVEQPAPTVLRIAIDLSDHGADLDRPHWDTSTANLESDPAARTAIDYRFVSGGPVGSFGYQQILDPHPLDTREVNMAATAQLGSPDGLLGATVRYVFK